MCQLLGISSQQPVNSRWLLADFFQRGGATAEHADGWGLAYYDELDNLQTLQSLSPAANCSLAAQSVSANIRSKHLISHIRKATYGEINLVNTHPFHRQFWGQDWVFCHNGDLHDYAPELPKRFTAQGNTDSERAFCYLLSQLNEKFAFFHPRLDHLADHIKQISDKISQFGSFNFILANNAYLITYASTELYWTQYQHHQSRIRLADSDKLLSDDEYNHTHPMIIVATKPLTKDEVWYPMGRGELRIFSHGQLCCERFADKPVNPAADIKNSSLPQRQLILI